MSKRGERPEQTGTGDGGKERGGSLPRMPGPRANFTDRQTEAPQGTDLPVATPGQSCPMGGTNRPRA